MNVQSVKKARSKIRKRKRQIQELYKMRVVYDLLNSEASKDQADDDDALAVFSLPATTTTTTTATTQAAASSVTATTSHPIRKSAKKDKTAGPSSSLGSTTSRTRSTGSKSVKRRADAILDWLSVVGCASEVKIRSIVGDSPDTSKALRL